MARSFNGSSDLIDAGTSATLNPLAETVSCWVYPTALTNAYQAVVSRNAGAGNALYQCFVKSNGTLAFYVNVGAGGGLDYDGTGSHTLSTNTWYHLVFSYSTAAGGTGYVNGASDGTFAAGATLTQSSINFQISNDQQNANRQFAGRIADVAVWSVVLTAAEVSALANGARPYRVRSGSLVGWWPLDGIASPEPDLSGNALNGTLTGTGLAPGPPIMMLTPRWPRLLPAAAQTFQPALFRRNIVVEGVAT